MSERSEAAPEDRHDERVPGLFQPDTILPTQYFDRLRRRTEYDGERRLMIAVLEDAVDVYRKLAGARDSRRRALFEDAEAWLESNDRTWIFSFENICDVLGLDAGYLRRGLHAYRRNASPGPLVVPLPTQHEGLTQPLRRASGS
jgi:hypothetical protein